MYICYIPTFLIFQIARSFVLGSCPAFGKKKTLAQGLENDPEEELAVLDQLIEWQRQTGEYGDAAK